MTVNRPRADDYWFLLKAVARGEASKRQARKMMHDKYGSGWFHGLENWKP